MCRLLWPHLDVELPLQSTSREQSKDEVFQDRRRLYAVCPQLFLVILIWDVLGAPRLSPAANWYDAFRGRKEHNIDLDALQFLQAFFNVLASHNYVKLELPVPFRILAPSFHV